MLIPLGEKLNVNINWLLFGKGEMFIDGLKVRAISGTDSSKLRIKRKINR